MLRVSLSYCSMLDEIGEINLLYRRVNSGEREAVRVKVCGNGWESELNLQGYAIWAEGGLALIARTFRTIRQIAPEQLKGTQPKLMKIDVWFVIPTVADDAHVTTLSYERRSLGQARIFGKGQVGVGHGPMDSSESANLLDEAAKVCVMLGFEVASGRFPPRPELRQFRDNEGNEFVYFEDVPPGVMPWFRAYVEYYFPTAIYRDGAVTSMAAWEAFRAFSDVTSTMACQG